MNALPNANIPTSTNNGLAPVVLPKAKSSQTGVSVEYVPDTTKRWYVLRILYGHTRQAADLLIHDGHYAYVAMVWVVERDKSGKKQKRKVPFLNLLFAYLTAGEAQEYARQGTSSRYITYYYNHFAIGPTGYNPPLTITERDMVQIIRATSLDDEHVMAVDPKTITFASDEEVLVTDGPFEGIRGRVARIARQNRVVILIPGLESGLTTAYIPTAFLQKVGT